MLQEGYFSFLTAALRKKRDVNEHGTSCMPFEAPTAQWLIAVLDGCDESNYSNMPVVERVLDCLVHLTAKSVAC